MASERNNNGGTPPHDLTDNRFEQHSSRPNDLPDSRSDREHMKQEETTIDLPDVSDIPGQEFVHGPSLDALGDTTISSADEEGEGLFDDENDDDDLDSTTNVSRGERAALEQTDYMPTHDEDNLQRASMDNTDFQGERLNEGSFGEERSGRDLDVPVSEDDDEMEASGAEDEENNSYSLGGDDNDNQDNRTGA